MCSVCGGTWGPKYLGIGMVMGTWGPGNTEMQGKGARGDPGKEKEKKRKPYYIPSIPTSTPYNTKLMYLKPEK
jgi:hypothetical protein